MVATEQTISGLAREALEWFEISEHRLEPGDPGEAEKFWRTKDNAPQWINSMVMEAHDDRMPNDWHYEAVVGVLNGIAEVEAEGPDDLGDYRHEIVDGLVDVYTGGLTAWLADNVRNVYYISEALAEFGSPGDDGFRLLGMAQYMAYSEVYDSITASLEAELEERE